MPFNILITRNKKKKKNSKQFYLYTSVQVRDEEKRKIHTTPVLYILFVTYLYTYTILYYVLCNIYAKTRSIVFRKPAPARRRCHYTHGAHIAHAI